MQQLHQQQINVNESYIYIYVSIEKFYNTGTTYVIPIPKSRTYFYKPFL